MPSMMRRLTAVATILAALCSLAAAQGFVGAAATRTIGR